MLGGAGMLIPAHFKGSATSQFADAAAASCAPYASQFGKQCYIRRDRRESFRKTRLFASARREEESASIDWSTLLNNPILNRFSEEQESVNRIERSFDQRLSKTIREQNLFRPGERLLVAVSGGQDSVCLLRMLANLRHQWDWVLGVVNCDHQWSSSSQHQGSHVSQIAASLGVNYYQAVTTSPVPGEGLARTWRYGVLQRIALRHGYTSIATAHTASDRVETLLYNLFRGSGLHGLQSLTWKRMLSPVLSLTHSAAFMSTGILSSVVSPEEGTFKLDNEVALVRPLLGFTRTELREYCDRLGLPLWPDASNMSLEIDRNRIRLELLPYLRENFNGSVDKSLARCAEILHAEQQYLDTICESILRKAETDDGDGRKLDIGVVQSLPVALQRRVLKQFVESFTGRSLGFDHVERLRGSYSLSADPQNGVNLELPGNATVRIDYKIGDGEVWKMMRTSLNDWTHNLDTIQSWCPYGSEEDSFEQSYVSILYLRMPPGFRLLLGPEAHHHNLVDGLMYSQELTCGPQSGADHVTRETDMVAVVTIRFVRDAKDHINMQGFNLYHRTD